MSASNMPRWIVARTRPGDGAPSYSGAYGARTPQAALQAYVGRYPEQGLGTRVDVRPRGADRRDITASFIRSTTHWEQRS